MKVLSLLHRWTGALIGLVLAVLGLSGAVLVWEDQWIDLPHSDEVVVQEAEALSRVATAAGPGLARITFADHGMSLHQLVFRDGSGAYVSQSGEVVATWSDEWGRPELWLFDLHHYLFAGEPGEWVAGVAGLIGLLFVASGLILWWRSRRAFRFRLLPRSLSPGPVVAHHRDLGTLTAPLLILSLTTGVLMLFAPLRTAVLGEERRPRSVVGLLREQGAEPLLTAALERFPAAALRRLTMPKEPGQAMTVRLRQPFEWTPNGRTQVGLEPNGSLWVEDAALANASARVSEKAYPLHGAKVGGWPWKIVMTTSGLVLAMLGTFTTWSFWRRKSGKRAKSRPGSSRLAVPA